MNTARLRVLEQVEKRAAEMKAKRRTPESMAASAEDGRRMRSEMDAHLAASPHKGKLGASIGTPETPETPETSETSETPETNTDTDVDPQTT